MLDGGPTEVSGEVIECGRRRRRRWTVAEKIRMVRESWSPGASASVVARRYDVNANLLFTWRRQAQRGEFGADLRCQAESVADGRAAAEPLALIPIEVQPASSVESAALTTSAIGRPGLIEIELPAGVRVRIDALVDEPALCRVLAAVKRTW
ncbi:IS66-like element accessory protein TnpA [Telmatospirillum sp.]|uniref:IS66-like element accessory protein TnpA n=1 Tax=Telmatospirillum sp. TaxID=2079197 RepID=UPI00284A2C2B|nr:transposase [Telmatospirillum sp.]MDR3436317.1 transposase [Telmatospirillum sp.]